MYVYIFRDSAIIAADGRIIHTEDIYSRFNNSNCPALLGKPKFFIVQACRGEETDRSNMMDYQEDELMHESGGNGNELKVKRAKRRWDACDQDSIPITMEPLDQCRPTWEDMIIAYSTIPGMYVLSFHKIYFILQFHEIFNICNQSCLHSFHISIS